MGFLSALIHPWQRPTIETAPAFRPAPPPVPQLDPQLDPQEVVAAAGKYSRSMLRTVGPALAIAFVAFIVQSAVAAGSQLAGDTANRTVILYPGLGISEAGSALLVLLPVSIALQILLRLPRDSEQLKPEDAIAQRQFWGSVAALVAAGSAFVGMGTFFASFLASVGGSTLNPNELFGAPMGAFVALMFAADAAATAQRENEKLELASAYRRVEFRAIATARGRVRGKFRDHPRRSLITWTSATLVLSVAATSALTWWLLQNDRATVLFGAVALMVTLFGAIALPRAVIAVLRGKPLDFIMQTLPPALVILVFALQLTAFAFPLIPQPALNEPWAYVPGIAYGLLLFLPVILVVTVLTVRSPWSRFAAPMLDYSRSSLRAAAIRLCSKDQDPRELKTWEIFAWAAIGASVVPFVSLPLAAAATLHRARSTKPPSRLFRGMWICTAMIAALEIVALLFLPVYAAALGWATI
ncbi:MAG: hypothetical protein ACOH19_10465 [Rhodoglobus sp.]